MLNRALLVAAFLLAGTALAAPAPALAPEPEPEPQVFAGRYYRYRVRPMRPLRPIRPFAPRVRTYRYELRPRYRVLVPRHRWHRVERI